MTERTEIATARLLTNEEVFRAIQFLDDPEGVKALRARIAALEAENAHLRLEVEDLSVWYTELWAACDRLMPAGNINGVLRVMERHARELIHR